MRKLKGGWAIIVKVLSFALIAFQLYTTGRGPYSDIIQRGVHLSFVLTLLFLLKPARKLKEGEVQDFWPVFPAQPVSIWSQFPAASFTTRSNGSPGLTKQPPSFW